MIEIICNGDDENKSEENGGTQGTSAKRDSNKDTEKGATNKSAMIRRPKNIKQIGDVSSDRKIYIEDYAFTYINSIAYGEPEEEQAGVLLGECQKTEDEKCIFIKGVIKAKNLEEGNQGIYFDERVWNNIYSDVDKYFPNLQVVGWFAAMPNITPERMQYVKKIHLDNFAGSMKTMYLINTIEKDENFYLYENGNLKEQKGYVCFYERNYEMQEYMLEKRGNKTTEQPENDRVVKSIRKVIQEKEETRQQKKNSTLLYSASAFLVVVVLVIGINLLNSYERMKSFDQSLSNIANQISDINGKDDNSLNASNENGTTDKDVVPVNKLNGDVYPTEETTDATQAETTAASETTAATEVTTQAADTETPTETAQPAAAEPDYEIHVVESGDTIMSICKKHYGNASKYSQVIELNGLADPDKLYVGQEIKLP